MSLVEEALLKEVSTRNINIETGEDTLSIKDLEPHLPELLYHPVHLDDDHNLVWPIVFLYPEFETRDTVVFFPENDIIIKHLSILFEPTPRWDSEKKYTTGNVNLYYENTKTKKVCPVDVNATLKEILQEETFLLRDGTPTFTVVCKNSATETDFLGKF